MSNLQENTKEEIASHADCNAAEFKNAYIKVIQADIESMERCLDERKCLLKSLVESQPHDKS